MRPDIDAIRKRCEAATPGPWEPNRMQLHTYNADAEFAAHARADIPALLDYVAELERRVRKLEERP